MAVDLNDLVRAKVFSPSNTNGEVPKTGYFLDIMGNHAFAKDGTRVGGFPLLPTDVALGLGFMPLPEAQTIAIAETQTYLANQVRVHQYDVSSPIFPAIYQRVLSEPAHEGKFQDALGFWFEIQPDVNGYIHAAWFGDEIAGLRLAQTVSKRLRTTPGHNYTMPVAPANPAPSNPVIVAADQDVDLDAGLSDFTIVQGADTLIKIDGTYADVQVVSAYNGATFTVPDATLYGKGNILKIADDITPHWWQQRDTTVGTYGVYRAGEFAAVDAGVGSTLTLADVPEWVTDRVPAHLAEVMNISIVGVTNAGGLCRVQTSHPHFYTSGLNILVAGVVGAVEANGTRPIVVVDATHYDIVGSSAPSAYVSGGTCRKTCTYSTHVAAALKVGRIRDGLARIRIGRILCAATVTSMNRFIRCASRKGIDFDASYIQRSAGIIFSIVDCFVGTVSYYADSTGANNVGYIVVFGGGHGVNAHRRGSGTVRHDVDGGAATSGDGITGIAAAGASAYMCITATGPNIGSTQVSSATHGGTYRWSWRDMAAVQGPSTVAVRGVGHTVYGARSSRAGGFGTFTQFFVGIVSAADNGSGGIRVLASGTDGRGGDLVTGVHLRVAGAIGAAGTGPNTMNGLWYITYIDTVIIDGRTYVHIDLDGSTFVSGDGAETAVIDSAFDAADDFTVIGCTGEDIQGVMIDGGSNGGSVTAKGNTFVSRETSSTSFVAGRTLKSRNNDMKFGTNSAIRIYGASPNTESVDINGDTILCDSNLPHIFDSNNLVQPIDVQMHNLEIRAGAGGTVASLFRSIAGGVSSPPTAGSRFGNIRIYGALTAYIAGMTAADFAPFVDGPIFVNGKQVMGPLPSPAAAAAPVWGYGNSSVTVTQATSKSTTVTANGFQGTITLNAASLAAGDGVSFLFQNSFIANADTLLINHEASGTLNAYYVQATCNSGNATVGLRNLTAGALAEAIILRFKVIKGE